MGQIHLTRVEAPASLSRAKPAQRGRFWHATAQLHWDANPTNHSKRIAEFAEMAKSAGAELLAYPELTISRYPADQRCSQEETLENAESLTDGPTAKLLSQLASQNELWIIGSLFELNPDSTTGGYNTALLFSPDGNLAGYTRKLHIPVTEGYFEDHYFGSGPAGESAFPTYQLALVGSPVIGMPTCWDEWFPELARSYALTGADLLCYPTAIGSEPDHPNFDTSELLVKAVTGHAISNGLFISVPNRWGSEGRLKFYGSSFVVDPFGRTLAKAARDRDEILLVEIDLDQRRDWLELFPFFSTRRPDTYGKLLEQVVNPRQRDGNSEHGGIPGIMPRNKQ